ncbi:MAG: YfiR family protein, partial [Planctomycetota bacterium]
KLKLAFLYKFATYVECKPRVEEGSIRIGVLGPNPFGKSLKKLDKKKPKGRKLTTYSFKDIGEYQDVDILFVSAPMTAKDLDLLREKTKDKSILIVGQTLEFLQQGGVMRFSLSPDGRIKIHLSSTNARQRKLDIDARLLKICQIEK